MFNVAVLIIIFLFPVGLVLGFCEESRMNYNEAAELLKKDIDN